MYNVHSNSSYFSWTVHLEVFFYGILIRNYYTITNKSYHVKH